MNQTLYSSQKLHQAHFSSVRKMCSILKDHFNVDKFYYTKIFNSGKLHVFDSNLEFVERWGGLETILEYPFYCHPQYQQSGVQIIHAAEDQQSMQMDLSRKCMSELNLKLCLRIAHKTEDAIEEFGFHSAQSDHQQTLFLFNQVTKLRLFSKFFRENNPNVFSFLEEIQTNLVDVLGANFYENKIQKSDPNYVRDQKVLQSLGIQTEAKLSNLELETIKLILNGYTASEIATRLYRSKRTIEHRIENIKSKWQCASKAELIQKAREFENGYSIPYF